MADESGISWTDSTFNPWLGCTKVGPGCDACYAEAWGKRFGVEWGNGKTRRRTSASNWRKPYAWNNMAPIVDGHRRRVFSASLADVFDNEAPDEWRADFWKVVKDCDRLDWLIVTKRIGNAAKMLPPDWGDGYPNVTMIATVVNQAEYDRDWPKLRDLPARRRGLSIEPMLGPINLSMHIFLGYLHWVIVGGESGPRARPMHPDWARSLRDQCQAAGVPFFFKQWGAYVAELQSPEDIVLPGESRGFKGDSKAQVFKVGKKAAGRLLDGRTHDGFPR